MRWSLLAALSFLAVATPSRAASSDEHRGEISGVVLNHETREGIEGALVVLQCACLPATRETQTNASGVYRFSRLPAGTYTVQVLAGQVSQSKVVALAPRSS